MACRSALHASYAVIFKQYLAKNKMTISTIETVFLMMGFTLINVLVFTARKIVLVLCLEVLLMGVSLGLVKGSQWFYLNLPRLMQQQPEPCITLRSSVYCPVPPDPKQ